MTIEGEFPGNYLLTEKVEVKTNRLELQDDAGIMLELDNNYGIVEDFFFRTATSGTIFVLKDAVKRGGGAAAAHAGDRVRRHPGLSQRVRVLPVCRGPRLVEDQLNDRRGVVHQVLLRLRGRGEPGDHPVERLLLQGRPERRAARRAGVGFDSAFASYTSEQLGGDPVQDYVKNARFLRNMGNGWFTQLFRNEEFVAQVNQLFEEQLEAEVNALPARIDEYAAGIEQSAAANFERWDVLGEPSVFPGGRGHIVADTWGGEVSYLRDWVETRVVHLTSAYGSGMPVMQYAAHVATSGGSRP